MTSIFKNVFDCKFDRVPNLFVFDFKLCGK